MGRRQDDFWTRRAYELAENGEVDNIDGVASALTREGCRNAAKLLAPGWMRDDIRTRVYIAWKRSEERAV